jgi:hypothetical protein
MPIPAHIFQIAAPTHLNFARANQFVKQVYRQLPTSLNMKLNHAFTYALASVALLSELVSAATIFSTKAPDKACEGLQPTNPCRYIVSREQAYAETGSSTILTMYVPIAPR